MIGHRGGPHKIGWPIFAALFLLPFFVPATRRLVEGQGPAAVRVLLALMMYAYGACYVVFPVVFGKPRRIKLTFGVVMLALGLLSTLLLDSSPYILLYATATLAFLFPAGWAVILDALALGSIAIVLLVDGRLDADGGDLISVGGITLAMFFMANLIRAVRRLERANEEIATLAVANERQRVARDLHDLLGHSLTTITVKAGLARRVLESSGDVGRAVEEIREVETLTRSALSDVRLTVSEYREVSLAAELAGARAALRAGEIDADLPYAVDNVLPQLQSTFGYVLREAVTNVLRHSGAKRVRVRLGRDWLEIDDDGTGADAAPGNGLRGLTERVGVVGGTLRSGPRPGGGWVVRAEVPAPGPAPVAAPAVRAEPAGGLA
ncbi:sensor histidine kinase [Amycolatopsis sp. FDAARGOS 1241]|uniref:sensor histidine kinase n=1 Tax=Amycolatopsis sp. FDAARGOS 1241 TaxID=2778070 RepID=UPI00195059FD|nr:sensor histidine kinase [Amycolatopsis sp. FDAARGOS 1241]QRP50718.1 sensor histidine kinase [Amycolatopsis sp. FDAARGOS 1241]